MILRKEQLHNYQLRSIEHIKNHYRSMLWLDLGLGKTISTLTATVDLMSNFQVYGALVVAPLRVAQTVWHREAQKWEHTRHLTFSLVHGSPQHREWALRKPANIYLVNYEGLPWVINQFINHYLAKGKPLPFNKIVIDEITKLKSTRVQQGGAWGKSLRKILPYVPWRTGLTATPAPNGYQDLFGQFLVLDDGARLGTAYNNFESAYFSFDRTGYKCEVTEVGRKFIESRVADITIQMDVDDYLELPPVFDNDIVIQLTDKLRKAYNTLESTMFLELDNGRTLDVDNAAVLSGKCRQFANGAVYSDQDIRTHWDEVHDLKQDALVELIEGLNGDPLLLGYQFKHDATRIKARLDKEGIRYVHYDSKIKGAAAVELEDQWNRGEWPVMIGHGQSIGHGLNLQYGCANVGWYGLPWSYEVYKQFNGRVAKRQGQTRNVRIHRLLVENTVDYLVAFALEYKGNTENDLRSAVADYRTYKLNEVTINANY